LLTSENQVKKRKDYLQILKRETQRLTALIEDLLTISRIESGRTQIQIKAVDISSIVRDLINDRKQMASHKGLDLYLDIPKRLPFAMVDPRPMNQVLSNLLTNAMNYTLSGGSITINLDNIKIDSISWIRISIQDTGVGIQPDELPYIFDRFYRGSSSKITQAPGTGLGLAISKEILERMDGKIQVESIPYNGSTFIVWVRAML
jgi:signal transduction histidine kinase